MPSKLQVFTGTSYDETSLVEVNVNQDDKITRLESDLIEAAVAVKIKDFQGMVNKFSWN